jgi:hypothetical protein
MPDDAAFTFILCTKKWSERAKEGEEEEEEEGKRHGKGNASPESEAGMAAPGRGRKTTW